MDIMSLGMLSIFGLVCGLFVVVFGLLLFGMYRSAQKDRNAVAEGIPATIRVLKVGQSETSRNYGTVSVNLSFEVVPPNGAVYQLMQVWDVDPASLDKIKEGNSLPIKIDARNPKKVYSVEPGVRSLNVDIDELFDDDVDPNAQ